MRILSEGRGAEHFLILQPIFELHQSDNNIKKNL